MNRKKKPENLKSGLQTLQKKAQAKGGHVSVQDILASFPGRELDESDISLIYRFADEENIQIDEYQLHDTRSVTIRRDAEPEKPAETGEDEAYFTMYLDELQGTVPCSPEEAEMLAQKAAAGDEAAAARLMEGHLSFVLDAARQLTGRGVLIADLVQEGNLELVTAVEDLRTGGRSLLSGGFRNYLSERVTRAMQALLEEQNETRQAAEKLARGGNRLLAAEAKLEDELGHAPEVGELAKELVMPEDDVRMLIRESLNAAQYANRDEEREAEAEAESAGEEGEEQDAGIHYEVEESGDSFFGDGYYGLGPEDEDEDEEN